jgi:hypothetical protein
MGLAFEGLKTIIDGLSQPVTVTYRNSGNHSQGINITANVAGTPFTCTLDNATGSVARAAVTANTAESPIDMATSFANLLSAINGGSEPVTASYVNSGAHEEGLLLTADEPGVSFTSSLSDGTGTMAVENTTPNGGSSTIDWGVEYTLLKTLIELSAEPVIVEFITEDAPEDGLLVSAEVSGTPFTLELEDETNDMTIGVVTENKSHYEVPVQLPQTLDDEDELAFEVPVGTVAMIVKGSEEIYIDSVTGVSGSQGFTLGPDIYMQLPISQGDIVYLLGSTSSSQADVVFLTLN